MRSRGSWQPVELAQIDRDISGIDGGHCFMLAGDMQIFDASVKERI